MRRVIVTGVAAIVLAAGAARAQPQGQAPRPLPARIDAVIGLPGAGPARFVVVTVDMSATAWAIEGCETSESRICTRTRRVILNAARRRELARLLEDGLTPRRCEPEGYAPGDPEYTLTMPTQTWSGHLPRDPAQLAARTRGPCAVATRLAWRIAQWFGTRGLAAPQGGGAGP